MLRSLGFPRAEYLEQPFAARCGNDGGIGPPEGLLHDAHLAHVFRAAVAFGQVCLEPCDIRGRERAFKIVRGDLDEIDAAPHDTRRKQSS